MDKQQRKNIPIEFSVWEQASIAAGVLDESLREFIERSILERIQRSRKKIEKAAQERMDDVQKL